MGGDQAFPVGRRQNTRETVNRCPW